MSRGPRSARGSTSCASRAARPRSTRCSSDSRPTTGAPARALAASWLPIGLVDRLDAAIAAQRGGDPLAVAREYGAFSARRNLASVYRMFVDRAGGDPQRLLEGLSALHATFYDEGLMRAIAEAPGRCRVEVDYAGAASRSNCQTAVGFYSEALEQLGVAGLSVSEDGCQSSGAPLCVFRLSWNAAGRSG